MERVPDLFQVVRALDATRGLASGLHCREQQGDEDGDDRDDYEELDEREAASLAHGVVPIGRKGVLSTTSAPERACFR
jgi:hypothetical protein